MPHFIFMEPVMQFLGWEYRLKGIEITFTQQELAERMASYDVGFLPMPEDIWSVVSPLKR